MQNLRTNKILQKIKFSIFCFIMVFVHSHLYSQNQCGTDILHQLRLKEDTNYARSQNEIESHIYNYILHKQVNGSSGKLLRTSPAIYKIPVVVHIIHNGGPENISDAQVLNAIQDLNDAYEHVAPYDGSKGIDTKIEFCLASREPDGDPTTGINRVISTLTDMNILTDDLALKDLIRWDPTSYLNIWVVNSICSGSSCNIAGYAYQPAMHGKPLDGVVCRAKFFGSSKSNSVVQIHEVGHYLGLYHTFEKGCPNGDCLLDGDRVCDTPPDNNSVMKTGCSLENTCSTDADDLSASNPFSTDVNDMIENFMDYSDYACANTFTQGQKDRMIAAITSPRVSLLSSKGCEIPCSIPFYVSYTTATSTVGAGTTVDFHNLSTGPISRFEWIVDDSVVSTSIDLSYTFREEGIYNVKLKGWSSDPTCPPKEFSTPINVTCPFSFGFSASSLVVDIGSSISFFNLTTDLALTHQWLVNGVLQSTSFNFTHTFTSPGTFSVTLISNNGTCSKRKTIVITVNNIGGECINMDFETGTAAYWNCYTATSSPTGLIDITPGTTKKSHVIMTGKGFDPNVGGTILPVVNPGGNYSLRLGDLEADFEGAIIQQKFKVTPTNVNFTYSYAVVLDNPGHLGLENAFFMVNMKDESGTDIPCASYSVVAEPPFTGFTKITGLEMYYKGWTTVTVPLAAYIGQNVTVTFSVSDCGWGAHLGYAYLDGSCLPLEIKGSKAICAGESITLTAPSGFSGYLWSGPGIVGVNNTPSITINLPGTYTVDLSSDAGPTCTSRLTTSITNSISSIDAGPDKTICAGNSVSLNATGGSLYNWSPSTGLSNPNIPNPIASPTTTTTYTVSSCGMTDQVVVTVIPNFTLNVTPDKNICANSTTISLIASPVPEDKTYEYSWSPLSSTLSDPESYLTLATIDHSTKFYVTVKDPSSGCEMKDSVNITLTPGFSLSPASSPNLLCHNSPVTSVTLEANPTITGTSISWFEGESLISTGESIVVSPTTTTTYTIKAHNGICDINGTITVPYYKVDAGPDKEICGIPVQLNGSDNLDESVCNYTLSNITYQNLFPDASWDTTVIHKDSYSKAIDIGFNFFYYCKSYSTFYISSNGFILFSPTNGGSKLPQRLPNFDFPNNLIALVWGDFKCNQFTNPYSMNCYSYKVFGSAPTRNLKVFFAINANSSDSPENTVNGYITLFESTNIIELHLGRQLDFKNPYTIGIENFDGTKSMAVPDRNRDSFMDGGKAYRFTPTNYVTYNWTPAPLYDGNTLTPTVSTALTTTYTVTADRGTCKSTDEVTVINNCGTLPIDLIDFDAKLRNQNVLLIWTVVLNNNFNFFSIERSTDGINWKSIGSIPTLKNLANYQFIDEQPDTGMNYYRIVMKEQNERVTFSPIKPISYETNFDVIISPNPFEEKCELLIKGEGDSLSIVKVVDMIGRVVGLYNINYNTTLEFGHHLSSGLYIVQIISEGKLESYKILKK